MGKIPDKYTYERHSIEEEVYTGTGVNGGAWPPQKLLRLLVLRYGEYVDLELGPGKDKQRSSGIGLNPRADPTADIWHDLNDGIPLPDESVDEIFSNQCLEHIFRKNFIFLMNEMWRVLKPGGRMEHHMPYFLDPNAVGDPTHFMQFSETSGQYYCLRPEDGTPFVEQFSDYGIECRFVAEIDRRRGAEVEWIFRKPLT